MWMDSSRKTATEAQKDTKHSCGFQWFSGK